MEGDTFDDRETGTILAALRFWQALTVSNGEVWTNDLEDSQLKDINNIATDLGKLTPLSDDEIDDLCEKINCHLPRGL